MVAKARLDSTSSEPWYVEWSNETGLAEGAWGPALELSAGGAEEAAEQFVKRYRPLFTGLTPESDVGDVVFVRGGTHVIDDRTKSVLFGEHYKGVPVRGATLHVHVRERGRVIEAGGSSIRIESLDVSPSLSAETVTGILRQALLPDSMVLYEPPELIVYPGPSPLLAYRLVASVRVHGASLPNEFLVDAKTGDILEFSNLYNVERPIYPSLFQEDTLRKADSAAPAELMEGHDYLGRVPVLQLSPADSLKKPDTSPPPPHF